MTDTVVGPAAGAGADFGVDAIVGVGAGSLSAVLDDVELGVVED